MKRVERKERRRDGEREIETKRDGQGQIQLRQTERGGGRERGVHGVCDRDRERESIFVTSVSISVYYLTPSFQASRFL